MQRRAWALWMIAPAVGISVGCFSSSSTPPFDGSMGGDAPEDVSAPTDDGGGPEASAHEDATIDATVEATVEAAVDAPIDSTLGDVTAPGVEAGVDASTDVEGPDGGDAGDASDAGDAGVDGGAGAVTSSAGLYMRLTRQSHTSSLLANGHVLICGGYYGTTASSAGCDDFNPSTNSISPGPSLVVGRRGHAATLLPSGQLLVAGGAGTNDAGAFNVLQSAEIYDPGPGTFTLVSNPMAEARSGPAVLLATGPNAGKVVLVGGFGDGTIDSGTPNDTALDSAEVFDPGSDAVQGTFTLLAAHMGVRRGSLTAAALPEGGLLAAGGYYGPGGGPYTYLSSAQTLDPALTAFTATVNAMSVARDAPQSVTLPDGRIFVFDGLGSTGAAAQADIYDPATGTFSATASLPATRNYAAVALLKSGRVMIAGGTGPSGTLGDVVVYDPVANTFLPTTGALNPPRALAAATTMNDGRVLISGGQTGQGFVSPALDIFTE
jgi:hypothetical protein